MSIGEAGGASFVQEVDVLNEEAEERNDDLQGRRRDGGIEAWLLHHSVFTLTSRASGIKPQHMELIMLLIHR